MNEASADSILQLLKTGSMEIEGALPWSSNYSFLARIQGTQPDRELLAVYKPRRGERPLWDFASGTLCQREVAAYRVSQALGWNLIPPTVLRQGPHGLGAVQLFVKHNPECHYFTIEGQPIFQHALQQIVLLDIIINNADRKGGHILLQEEDTDSQAKRLWAIDHGVCFHTEYKLRTVVWEFAGMPIPPDLLIDLAKFQAKMHASAYSVLQKLLNSAELLALDRRIDRIIQSQTFIQPGPGRHYPWPPV